jgi:FlaA1/EpsC-like NDP-sugar epimerase/EAL domain-containing protein (putative c-di-GMP-specific phosphodiesterase class I)
MRYIFKILSRLKNRHFLFIDAIIFSVTTVLALEIRLDGAVDFTKYQFSLLLATVLFLSVKLLVLRSFGFYKRYWRYANIDELVQVNGVMTTAIILQSMVFAGLYGLADSPFKELPRSLPVLDGLLSIIFVGGIRFSIQAIDRVKQKRRIASVSTEPVLIVGAGSAGISLVQKMQQSTRLGLCPVAFIDDDPEKLNLRIQGLPVVGNRHKIPQIVRSLRIRRIIIAIPIASGNVIREILNICQTTEAQTRTLPGIHEILSGRAKVESIRDIQIEDLLRREPIQTNFQRVSQSLSGKRVLVTGAGGSIGSELCRQILKCHPAEIILLGKGENSIFNIEQELERTVQGLKKEGEAQGYIPKLTTFICDIRSLTRLKYAFDRFRPEIVFHAAAHKHVPLMELNPPEAMTNNILGTKNLLDLAVEYDVERFVMISTDKAVNPTNVMGASKRVAEMLVLQTAQTSGKSFAVVRFGNVLGSRGSVVPTFKQQIAAGGPITVTHPDIRRYFMTIPEAVQLTLQASVLSRGGEVFMLDMGQPVKIVDLARDLISLSGYEVDKEIKIAFTGLRPGEKLYEELFIPGEQYERTQHEKIIIVHNASSNLPENLMAKVEALSRAATKNDADLIVFLLEKLVLGYAPNYSQVKIPSTITKPNVAVLEKLYNDSCDAKDLQLALERQEFRLFYQPIVLLETGDVTGFEALLRWQHPVHGLIAPAEFISVAEETGLIIPIGWWAICEACRQMSDWQKQFHAETPMTISVNLSSKQLLQPCLVTQIDRILQEVNLAPSSLRLEIPESIIRETPDPSFTLSVISQLKALGLKLQMDNFGVDYESLDGLRQLQSSIHGKFDSLKFDRSFINHLNANSVNLEFIQTVVKTAQDLGIDITAAGVETPGQTAQLKTLKFKYGQGFFFSKPVEGEDVKTLFLLPSVLVI